MPIYEFYCGDCHRVFHFFSRRIDTESRPACPRCGRPELARRVAPFAISKGLKEEAGAPPPGFDESRLEQVMESFAAEAEAVSEDDPRQQAALMRRLFDATGMPLTGNMQEALRRMEAGENPEDVEQDMGDLLEGEEGLFGEPRKTLGSLRRRLLAPSVDPTLYEL
jgi:putative FmdB family regulatory protein